MKRADLYMIIFTAILFVPFFLCEHLYDLYMAANGGYPLTMAFVKFAILATMGEMLGLRIKSGFYSEPSFGMIPRAVVWGILGMGIATALRIFSLGVPAAAQSLGIDGLVEAMGGSFSGLKLLGAFLISITMNALFAPVFMTLHRITDTHILNNKGKISALTTPIPMGKYLSELNWNVQWGFVLKKTIIFFWVPAHTITFILPVHFQVLFAALLGVSLGVFLSIAAVLSRR